MYDNLGQLTRVNDPADTKAGSTGTTWVYDYDRGGNILSKKYYAYTTGTLGSVKGTEAFTYGASNWGDKLATYKGTTVTYTGANIKKVDGWTYSYGYNNLLTKATKGTSGTAGYEKVTFSYDALGRLYERVHTVYNEEDGQNHAEFFSCFWNGDKLVHITRYTKVGSESYTKTDALHFYYDADGKPSHVQLNDTRFFYQYNLQGDVIGILAGGHSQVVRYEYDAWGKVISITGDRKDNLGKYNPFRYRHYMYDDSVSLYYLKSRHYHPALCRFLQADSALGLIGAIGQHNLFSYCGNNPISNSDPNGKKYVDSICDFFKALHKYFYPIDDDSHLIVSEFIANAKNRLRTPYARCMCSTLIDSAAGQKTPSAGMSTMMREKSLVVGEIQSIGFENLPSGTILCKLESYNGAEYNGGPFDPSYIQEGDVSHGGILLGTFFNNSNELCISVLQSTAATINGFAGVQVTTFTEQKMKDLGWNTFMWDIRVMPDDYRFMVRETVE